MKMTIIHIIFWISAFGIFYAYIGYPIILKIVALFVNNKDNKNVILASRNIANVKLLNVKHLNIYDLLKHDEIVLTKEALTGLEASYK